MPRLSRGQFVAIATLGIAFLASLAIYGPALRSPFLGDDYRFLLTSRDLRIGDFLRASLDPGADPIQSTIAAATIASDHWRPLNWILFRVLYSLFGDASLGYHLFSLGIHLSGVVMVWLLARRLVHQTAGVVAATLIFAIHPAGFESVTWVSTLSSAALPLTLGGWLAFIAAVESGSRSARLQLRALAVLLIVLALLMRETAVMVFPAMGLWYILLPNRAHFRKPRSYAPLVPYVLLPIIFMLVSTAFFTAESGGSEGQLSFDVDALRRMWYYTQQALMPTDRPGPWALIQVRRVVGLATLAVPIYALLARRWPLLALSLAFFASLVPYGLFSVGYGPRYFYMPSAFFALAAGSAVAETWPLANQLLGFKTARAAAIAGLVLAVAIVTLLGNRRVDRWAGTDPAQEQRWIDELRQTHPQLPDGGTLYVSNNMPLTMALLGGYVVEPTVAYLYPEGHHKVQIFFLVDLEAVRPWLEPKDRLFVFSEK